MSRAGPPRLRHLALLTAGLPGCTLVPTPRSVQDTTATVPEPDPAWLDPAVLQVATFNIDWLDDRYASADGTQFTPRDPVDYEMIAALITAHDLDLVALQEIDGDAAMALLPLPERYAWVVGDTGWSQNPVILYDADKLEVSQARDVPLVANHWPSKDPLAARVRHRASDLAFTFVVVHMNPYADPEEAAYRQEQVAELHHWTRAVLPTEERAPYADHVVVAGDFNDTFEGIARGIDTLEPFEQDPDWWFATWDTEAHTELSYRSQIDHIVVSRALWDRYPTRGHPDGAAVIAHDELEPWNRYSGYGGHPNISSHRPVWVGLAVEP